MLRELKAIGSNSGANEIQISSAEKALEINFPKDYRGFMLASNGAEGPLGSEGYIAIWPIDKLIEINRNYEAPNLVLFAGDGGGELFGFDKTDTSLKIAQVPTTDLESRIVISKSFSDFIENYEVRLFIPIR